MTDPHCENHSMILKNSSESGKLSFPSPHHIPNSNSAVRKIAQPSTSADYARTFPASQSAIKKVGVHSPSTLFRAILQGGGGHAHGSPLNASALLSLRRRVAMSLSPPLCCVSSTGLVIVPF